jgi:transcriptional regulator with XRE-family HTH domain
MTGPELKAAREKLGLSARALAQKLGMRGMWDDRTVRRWESGERRVPADVAEKVKSWVA